MLMKKILRSLPPFLFSVIVIAAVVMLTCFPVPEMVMKAPSFLGADKIVHAIMFYGVVSALVFDVCRKSPSGLSTGMLAAFLAGALVLGGITELVQAFADINRSGDINDFIADSIGAFVGWLTSPRLCKAFFSV